MAAIAKVAAALVTRMPAGRGCLRQKRRPRVIGVAGDRRCLCWSAGSARIRAEARRPFVPRLLTGARCRSRPAVSVNLFLRCGAHQRGKGSGPACRSAVSAMPCRQREGMALPTGRQSASGWFAMLSARQHCTDCDYCRREFRDTTPVRACCRSLPISSGWRRTARFRRKQRVRGAEAEREAARKRTFGREDLRREAGRLPSLTVSSAPKATWIRRSSRTRHHPASRTVAPSAQKQDRSGDQRGLSRTDPTCPCLGRSSRYRRQA